MTQHTMSIWQRTACFLAAAALAFAALAAAPAQAEAGLTASSTAAGETADTSAGTAKAAKATPAKPVAVHYQVKSKKVGWSKTVAKNKVAGTTGKSLRLTALRISIDTGAYQGSVRYRARLNSGKWTKWKRDGATLASNQIEAVQVQLTGSIAEKYDVVYRAHIANIGWQRRMRNAEVAGTDQHLQLEALRINLVSKAKRSGWVLDGTTWSFYQSGKRLANTWIVTNEHPLAVAEGGLHRYWVDSKGLLAVERYVNPKKAVDKKARWTAYATSLGYVARGKYNGPYGMLLADNEGKLHTKTRWLTTSAFDGSKQKYRLVKKGPATVVKTGLFKVGKNRYYAYEDGRGYVMRSTTWWVANNWYKASWTGALTKASNSNVIERYVKWAVAIANDDSHGYSQADRWGPDYDCSSLVCSSLLASGFPDSGASWTGNMKSCLTKIGFVWHAGTAGLRRGDIMLVHSNWRQHTEIYLGNDQLVGAHIAETGGVTGRTGDQTGNEISVTRYYNAPWQGYLRYKG